MTVQQLCANGAFTVFNMGDENKQILNDYCGDFLSNIISRAPDSCAWLTVMNNVNVAAVATLIDCACIVLCEGVKPDNALLEKAKGQGLNLLGSDQNAFETTKIINGLCGV